MKLVPLTPECLFLHFQAEPFAFLFLTMVSVAFVIQGGDAPQQFLCQRDDDEASINKQ